MIPAKRLLNRIRQSEKGKLMHTFNSDLFRFELTASNLIISIKDATEMSLSPTEALELADFLASRRREIRREQRLLERGKPASYYVTSYECLEMRTYRFLYLFGWLTIIDLQHTFEMEFHPSNVLLLDNFLRAHRRALENMPQDLEVLFVTFAERFF